MSIPVQITNTYIMSIHSIAAYVAVSVLLIMSLTAIVLKFTKNYGAVFAPFLYVAVLGCLCGFADIITEHYPYVPVDMAVSILPIVAVPAFASGKTMKWVTAIALVMLLLRGLRLILELCFGLRDQERLAVTLSAETVALMFVVINAVCIAQFIFDVRNYENVASNWVMISSFIGGVYIAVVVVCIILSSSFYSYGCVPAIASLILPVPFALSLKRGFKGCLFALCKPLEAKLMNMYKVRYDKEETRETSQNTMYRELFNRVESYFTCSRPYLDANLTIQDVARVLFTNKVYISRAVALFRGLNFCQYVNEFRVRNAKTMMESDPDIKVSTVSIRSGFNSIVSFSTAFKLFEGITPSQWARKQKLARLPK